ncbi:hypothetical protein D9M69_686480 [compost metagenome]
MPFRLSAGGGSSGEAHGLIRAGGEVTASAQVENRGRRDNGNHAALNRETPPLFLAPALDPPGGDEAIGTASGQHHGVHGRDQTGGVQRVGFVARGTTAADIH